MNIVDGQGMPDFVMLDSVSEEAFMGNLKVRFKAKQIYTYIGEQIVAMNPFTSVAHLYGPAVMQEYRNMELYEVQPHIYGLADDTFRNLMRTKADQCVLITGESGAGKTEASKIFMQYIVHVSNSKGGAEMIKERLLDSNPVLEAFGNAKTVRNDNSSRFGKYMEIQFDGSGSPVGGKISQYLLEKSRVVTRSDTERSFHIFYNLLTQNSLLGALELKSDAKSYRYLNLSNCFSVRGMNDSNDFNEVQTAMVRLGFSDEDQQTTWQVLAAILHIGNIDFAQSAKDQSKVANPAVLKTISKLLAIDTAALERALTTNELNTVGSKTLVQLDKERAGFSRDSMAKAMYSKIFDWVVETINSSIALDYKPEMVIGVLDIYGFEIFTHNSFEQFCINFCNEKLQQLFIRLVLLQEQAEYAREGIEWQDIDYFNNAPIVDLIEGTPGGMYKVLDEACMVGQTTPQDLLEKLKQTYKGHAHFAAWDSKNKDIDRDSFRIRHYAGDVDYEVKEFVFKNRDTLYRTIKQAFRSSKTPLVKNMFPEAAKSRKRPVSAGWQFKLAVNKLIERLNACQPHYIRCIKSNEKKAGFVCDDERVKHQVRYLNLVETVRVRRAGFCNRQLYTRFVARYKMVSAETWPRWHGTPKDGCKVILDCLGIQPDEYRLGKTKLFVRNASTLSNLERQRDTHMPKVAVVIQRTWRKLRVKGKALRYMHELCKAYPKSGGNPNYGPDCPVPPPKELANVQGLSKKMLESWWLAARVLALSPAAQSLLRSKVRTYNLFHGNKAYDLNTAFVGDYLAADAGPKEQTNLQKMQAAIRNLEDNTPLVFACKVMRVNQRSKPQFRAIALTETSLYRLDPKSFKVKKDVFPLEGVEDVWMSHQTDTFVLLRMRPPAMDIIIDVGLGGNHVAEFVSALSLYGSRARGSPLPIHFADTITYNHNRTARSPGKDHTLTFAKNPKGATPAKNTGAVCLFKKMKGTQTQVLY